MSKIAHMKGLQVSCAAQSVQGKVQAPAMPNCQRAPVLYAP